MSERWQDIPGYEGLYQCSTLGNIRSVDRQVPYRGGPKTRIAKGQLLSPYVSHKGYAHVVLCHDGKRHVKELHTLIAATFLGPRPERHHTHHINGDKLNNRPANLKYVPVTAHHQHHHQGTGCHKAVLTDREVVEILDLLKQGKYQKDIAKMFGVGRSTIGEIDRGRTWKHIARY